MLISEEYRNLNLELHQRNPHYGVSGQKWAEQISEICSAIGAKTILDYGCGKQTLGMALSHLLIVGYDPAIPGLDAPPEPADLTVCTDVLEHIEPDCLDAVLDDLERLALKGVFLTVATRPAKKFLADGRNAHLIQQPAEWWLPKIMQRWHLKIFHAKDGEFAAFAIKKEEELREAKAA